MILDDIKDSIDIFDYNTSDVSSCDAIYIASNYSSEIIRIKNFINKRLKENMCMYTYKDIDEYISSQI